MSDFCLWILNLASLLVFFVGFFIFWYNHPWFLTVKGERKKTKNEGTKKNWVCFDVAWYCTSNSNHTNFLVLFIKKYTLGAEVETWKPLGHRIDLVYIPKWSVKK